MGALATATKNQPHVVSLNKAKIRLMMSPNSAFITTICFSMDHVWDDRVPTAATDGKTIYFNIGFWNSLDAEEQFFLLQHEAWHVCFMHMLRLASRIAKVWNIAADHVINLMLIEMGYKMPKDGYADPKYKNMSTDQVYDLIVKSGKKTPESYQMDLRPHPEEGDSAKSQAEVKKQVEDIIIRAALNSKKQDASGTIPGAIQLFLDSLLKPKLPMRRLLTKYFQNRDRSDYSYRKFNRRFFPSFYLPTLEGPAIIDLVTAVDISGSVMDHEFAQFIGEIGGVIKALKPRKVTILQFDTQIRHIDEVESVSELMKVKFTGRGGTAIEPVLNWAKKHNPAVVLVFTDGGFRFHQPAKPKKTDFVWLIHGGYKFPAPFGKVINYTI